MNNWHSANQQYTTAALALIKARLQNLLDGVVPAVTEQEQKLQEAAQVMPNPPALANLCQRLGLSNFERDIVLLCAGFELDKEFSSLYSQISNLPYPTFGLALSALAEAHWSALVPAAPLRRWQIIEVGQASSLTTSPLRLDERVLHYLMGASYLDERLEGLVQPAITSDEMLPSQAQLARRMVEIWHKNPRPPVVQLESTDIFVAVAVAAQASQQIGAQLLVLQAEDIPVGFMEREALLRLWEREAVLSGSILLINHSNLAQPDKLRPVLSFVEQLQGMLVVTGREPLNLQRASLRLELKPPEPAEQKVLWQTALGPLSGSMNGAVDQVVSQFKLGGAAIRVVGQRLQSQVGQDTKADLWEACRVEARTRLDDLAQRISSDVNWDDLILPELQRQQLREIAIQVQQRNKVYESWGFAARSGRGLGISALFAGASGTGKTLAAEVLSHELKLDLYRLELSAVVSKYIGETEKNLQRVFDAAEQGGAILLFDEADALFGRRSEVKDSHDRYANIEVSYLLQRMEAYRGLAILTSNFKAALDTAFLRRLRFIVNFPFPDATSRAEIWKRVFPAATPTQDLDINSLARLNISGGHIRNIALAAAFLAAHDNQPVKMSHLLQAAHGEYAKLEKPLTEAEIAGLKGKDQTRSRS